MNYSENDLRNLRFGKSFRGYRKHEVNLVIGFIIEDYQNMWNEIQTLKGQLGMYREGIEQYQLIEVSLKNALVVAQQTAEEIKKGAQERADATIREADMTGRQMVNKANEQVSRIKAEYENVRKEIGAFKARIESLFMAHLKLINKSIGDALAAAGGSVTSGNVAGGNVAGGNVAGGNVTGANVAGGNIVGGNTAGGNAVGGNVVGGNAAGGNVMGANVISGSIAAGNVAGGNVTGGNVFEQKERQN